MRRPSFPLLNLITETAIGLTSSEWKVESALKWSDKVLLYSTYWKHHVLNDCSNQVNVVYNNVKHLKRWFRNN
jgi:hypothetical protein